LALQKFGIAKGCKGLRKEREENSVEYANCYKYNYLNLHILRLNKEFMKKRIFVAIDISDEARIKVADYIKDLRGGFSNLRVGWEKAEKLHLTVKFLGDIDSNELQNLIEAVEITAQQISNFKLQISRTGVFPSKRNARILWLGVDGEHRSLQKINDILETECRQKGFVEENRKFKAHLTIGRLREPNKSKELIDTHLNKTFAAVKFEVSEIVIYESRLQKSGSIFTKYKNINLQG
jgi:2'-5' RNA ligase